MDYLLVRTQHSRDTSAVTFNDWSSKWTLHALNISTS